MELTTDAIFRVWHPSFYDVFVSYIADFLAKVLKIFGWMKKKCYLCTAILQVNILHY